MMSWNVMAGVLLALVVEARGGPFPAKLAAGIGSERSGDVGARGTPWASLGCVGEA
jgi:hypothetical protein